MTRMPVVLKGVLDPADAERAVQEGVEGIIVSNHGGRNLDTSQATVTALPEIVERVDGRVPILVDGGIRRGTDVLNALALGARSVLLGRPYRYGLPWGGGAGGGRGVRRQEGEEGGGYTCGRWGAERGGSTAYTRQTATGEGATMLEPGKCDRLKGDK